MLGCLDFSITADTAHAGHIRIYERWTDEQHMLIFRGTGPSSDQQAAILDADVRRFGISTVGDP